jgi:hypothetical protein
MIKQTNLILDSLDEIILHKWIQVLGILMANNAWIGLKHVFQQVRLIEFLSKLMFSNWYESTHSIRYHVIFWHQIKKYYLDFYVQWVNVIV